jgi:hypothetical protein
MDTSKRTARIDPAARSWRGPTGGALILLRIRRLGVFWAADERQ